MSMNSIIPVGTSIIGDHSIQTVNARDLHSFLGVGRDFSTWIKSRIDQYGFEKGVDYCTSVTVPQNGGIAIEYHISFDMGKELGMVERNEKGREVRRYFIDCERRANSISNTMKALPENYADALRMLANEIEIKELALAQRDEAIRTKAEIGTRREATAMATASAAVRKANQLEDELGRGKQWKAATAIPWISEYFSPTRGLWIALGRKLGALSVDMNLEIRKAEHDRFGSVNLYHVDVIEEMRGRIASDENMLGKYRK